MSRQPSATRCWITTGATLALMLCVGAVARAVGRAPVRAHDPEPVVASVTILGRRDLHATGDTATWCAVAVLQDGTLRLGRRVLLVRAESPSVVRAAAVTADAPARCAALLRARGLDPDKLPLIDNDWDTRPVPPPTPHHWRRATLAPPTRA